MIQANELRIFNWVADRGGKQWQIDHWESMNKVSAKPSTSMCMGILIENHPMTEYLDYLYPIPLTEEWLLKVGAKRFGKDFTLHGVIIHTRKRGFVINKSVPIMKYLHQLQNFIFANRGKELEFKL